MVDERGLKTLHCLRRLLPKKWFTSLNEDNAEGQEGRNTQNSLPQMAATAGLGLAEMRSQSFDQRPHVDSGPQALESPAAEF